MRRTVAAVVPGADHPRDVLRTLEAERLQRLQRVGIVLLAGEDEVAGAGRQRLLRLEEPAIALLDGAQDGFEFGGEDLGIGKAQHQRDAAKLGVAAWEKVGLLVMHHLQAMLDIAQEPVADGEFAHGRRIDPVGGIERLQPVLGGPDAKLGHAPAGNQLLGLDEEFDLPNAAAAELDVVALDRNRPVALVGVDLPLDRVDVGDGRIIQVFAEDEGAHFAKEGFAGPEIPADRSRLDEGGPLPVLAASFVVEEGGIDRDGKRR